MKLNKQKIPCIKYFKTNHRNPISQHTILHQSLLEYHKYEKILQDSKVATMALSNIRHLTQAHPKRVFLLGEIDSWHFPIFSIALNSIFYDLLFPNYPLSPFVRKLHSFFSFIRWLSPPLPLISSTLDSPHLHQVQTQHPQGNNSLRVFENQLITNFVGFSVKSIMYGCHVFTSLWACHQIDPLLLGPNQQDFHATYFFLYSFSYERNTWA